MTGATRGPGGRVWLPIACAAAAAILVATLGALMTDLGNWYVNLDKPSWQPPDWLFGPAWTLIFALAAASGVLAWRGAPDQARAEWIVGLFALNGFLNVLWSLLFFRLHRPDWALWEVGFLWLSILALIVMIAPASATGSWLLAPYLVWVSFASALNVAIVRLNAPFG